MDDTHQIRAVIHGDVRLVIEGGLQMIVIGGVVFALDGVDRDFVIGDQRGGNIILSRERIGGAQDNISTTDL